MATTSRDRQVLCPIDFSDSSARALRYAAAFAERTGATLTVLYVNDPLLSTAAAAAGYDQRGLDADTDRELRRFIERTVPKGRGRPPVDERIRLGKPAREIKLAARETGAGLIVMGTHGLTGARKVLLGSTTEHTLRDATVPVLAVPHGAPARPRRNWPNGPLMAGIDLGSDAREDVRAATAVARMFDADLLLVHVTGKVRAPAWFKPREFDSAQQPIRARGRLAGLAAMASDDDVSVSFRVVRGDPATSLARVARTAQAGTLFLVLRRGKGVFGMARGTVTYRVLTTAVTPVIAVPAGWRSQTSDWAGLTGTRRPS